MRLKWCIQTQPEDNGLWKTSPSGTGFGTRERAEKFMEEFPNTKIWRIVPDGPDPELSDTVLVLADGEPFVGTVVEVNDKDQGDFEYYVFKDANHGSYWPRENLAVLEWLREAPN